MVALLVGAAFYHVDTQRHSISGFELSELPRIFTTVPSAAAADAAAAAAATSEDAAAKDDDGGGGGGIHFNSGVLQRVGLLFFVGIYFVLTTLVTLHMWHHERLLYFQESAAGCYGALTYLASKLFFDVVPLRLLPALLAAAIVYPMSGLRHDAPDWSGLGSGLGLGLGLAWA